MKNKIAADFPFESKYITVRGNNIHYIDKGQGDPVLFLHGNPTSSYLWRNIIPYLTQNARCIAPDLIGMGQSAQPDLNYGFNDSYEHLLEFIEQLGLKNITLVLHDWGSGLGFHYANQHRSNIKGIAFMEAVYRLVDFGKLPIKMRIGMTLMRLPLLNSLMISVGNFFLTKMLPNAIVRKLSPKEIEYYNRPYPTVKSRKAVRVWPKEIPINGKPTHTHQIVTDYHEWLKTTQIPKICFYAEPGMLIPKSEIPWIERNFPNTTLVNIGKGLHFIQEDNPHKIGSELAKWYQTI